VSRGFTLLPEHIWHAEDTRAPPMPRMSTVANALTVQARNCFANLM